MPVEIKGIYMLALNNHNVYINFARSLGSEDICNVSLMWFKLRIFK